MRLPRWLTPWRRREPAPVGRHVRTATPVTVPGAASALVAAAAEPVLVAEAVAAPEPPAPVDVPLSGTPEAVLAGPEPEPGSVTGSGLPDDVPPGGTVALGFADGAEVMLDPDDPRVAALRAAADAVLEQP